MKNINEIIKILQKEYPQAKIALNFSNPIELLVATILSAQCTDERVNKVTKELFKKYKTVDDYANADIKKFEQEIKPTGFYKMKAKNIINAAKIIKEKFNGKVPDTMEDLMSLPGVARKTANVVLSNAYGKVEGIVVDTHVRRLSYRIGLTKNTEPNKIEQDLMKIVPKDKWFIFPYLLIDHGRKICSARKPLCEECVINKYCEKVGVKENVRKK
jgi:endonuclease-3